MAGVSVGVEFEDVHPRPWHIYDEETDHCCMHDGLVDADGDPVWDGWDGTFPNDATLTHIVDCVNEHDALKRTIKGNRLILFATDRDARNATYRACIRLVRKFGLHEVADSIEAAQHSDECTNGGDTDSDLLDWADETGHHDASCVSLRAELRQRRQEEGFIADQDRSARPYGSTDPAP